jgi:hypothetical protein
VTPNNHKNTKGPKYETTTYRVLPDKTQEINLPLGPQDAMMALDGKIGNHFAR